MFVNKHGLLLVLVLVATSSAYNGDEEDVVRPFAAAKYRTFLDKAALRRAVTADNTGKHNSNKEILFGDDDEGDRAVSKTKASVNPERKKAVSAPVDDEDKAGASASSELHERLSRSQRTDHSLKNKQFSAVKAKVDDFHRSHNNWQDRLDYDLEQALLDELSQLELDEEPSVSADDMQADEIVPQQKQARLFLNANGMQPAESVAAKKQSASEPLVITNLKENLFGESEYNNNLKAPVEKPTPRNDPFTDNEFLDSLGMTIESLQKSHDSLRSRLETQRLGSHDYKHMAGPIISEEPSMALKQSHDANPFFHDKLEHIRKQNDYLFMFIIAGCTLAAVVALVAAGTCWYTVHRNATASPTNVEYGGSVKEAIFGSSGSVRSKASTSSGDRRLAQSAQMYHYQHQKQQMIAMEKANNDTKPDNSDNSEGETEEGDYTVYECPGLAPTGEMEVKNPLFKEDFSQSSQSIFLPAGNPPEYKTLMSADATAASTLVSEPVVEEPASKSDEAEAKQAPPTSASN